MENLPLEIRELLKRGLIQRLPVTFQPFFNEEVREWDSLWPYEQGYIVRVLDYLGGLNDAAFKKLFQPLHALEAQMGVQGEFSTREESLEEASILARSPHYLEWQQEVRRVNEAINRGMETAGRPSQARRRLILLVIPARLVLAAKSPWQHWGDVGRPLTLDISGLSAGRGSVAALLGISGAPH